ncbi:MAG: hypothetical protein WB729_05780 [Candidatus Sulfotelmatobacter sp.]
MKSEKKLKYHGEVSSRTDAASRLKSAATLFSLHEAFLGFCCWCARAVVANNSQLISINEQDLHGVCTKAGTKQ